MRLSWSFRRFGARWDLVMIDLDRNLYENGGLNVAYDSHYGSKDPTDIIDAMIYLNSGHVGRLQPHTLQTLEQIRKGSPDRREPRRDGGPAFR